MDSEPPSRFPAAPFAELTLEMWSTSNGDGYFVELNDAWTRTLGWSVEELRAKPSIEFVHPDDRASTRAQVARTVAAGDVIEFRNRYQAKDGAYHILQWTARMADGILYAICRDMTEVTRLTDALPESEERWRVLQGATGESARDLKRSHDALDHFAYIASHDLREPLRMVTSYLRLIERRYASKLDDEAREFIAFAVDGARRLDNMILALLEVSRAGRVTKVRKHVDTNRLVQDVLQDLAGALKEANATVEVGDLPGLVADPDQVSIVLENLLQNAIRFRRDVGPHIKVSGQVLDDGFAEITVQDNGIGIDPSQVPRIFGIFQRLHVRDAFPGDGIGLTVCDRIVRAHGGEVAVESVPGEGSTFRVRLPIG